MLQTIISWTDALLKSKQEVFLTWGEGGEMEWWKVISPWIYASSPVPNSILFSSPFIFFIFPSLLQILTPLLFPGLPDFHSVQQQGTGSWHWLDFHTAPSTERHIKLIRVNNCSRGLLSRAPIGLAWPDSGDADGLVISLLGAKGMHEARGSWFMAPCEGNQQSEWNQSNGKHSDFIIALNCETEFTQILKLYFF